MKKNKILLCLLLIYSFSFSQGNLLNELESESENKTSNEIIKRGLLEKIFGGVGPQQELPTTP